jgi:hypothetical protein
MNWKSSEKIKKIFSFHAPQWSLLRGGLTQKHPPEHSIPPVSIFWEKSYAREIKKIYFFYL